MIDTMVKHKPMPNVKCEFDMQNELRPMPQVRRCDNSKAHFFNSLTLIVVRCSFLAQHTTNQPTTAAANGVQSQNYPILPLNTTNFCFVCQKNYATSSEFIVHIRSHFLSDRVGSLAAEDVSSPELFNRAVLDCGTDELWHQNCV